MTTTTLNKPATPKNIVREDDMQQHVEDDRSYGAIRGGKLISNLTWNELTDAEQSAARSNVFYNQYYY